MNNSKPIRYVRSLDGLRAIAVMAVIAYHLDFEWASGGLLGVTIFFVLSGYLITNLLLIEYEKNNKIDLKNFWIRRMRRLLPGMLATLFAVTAWATLFAQPFLERLRDDFLPAVLYYSNWWYIFQDLSYFEAMSTPSLLTHFWSLAIEEQFYVVWPLIIVLGFLCKLKKKHLVKITLFLTLLSGLLMAILYNPTTDPSRIYYGTDTRAFSLLIGALLAFAWPSNKMSRTIPLSLRRAIDTIGTVCLLTLLSMMVFTNQYDSFLYRGGMFLASLLTVLLLAVLVHPASKLSRLMTFKPLTWIGVRSYGIYLWHFPVILLTKPQIDTSEPSFARIIFQIALSFGLAALSYRYIEKPIKQGALRNCYIELRNGHWSLSRLTQWQWFGTGCLILILCISVFGLTLGVNGKSQTETTGSEVQQAYEQEEQSKLKVTNKEDETSQKMEPADQETASTIPVEDYKITTIGDSVMINAEPFLKNHFPNITVDANIGRQMYDITVLIEGMKQDNSLGDFVVIALGTNGAFTSDQLSEVITTIGPDRQIILINTRVPKNWESIVNNRLEDAASKHSNISLLDWYSASSGHNEYFASDGVHLTKTGAQVYADMLITHILQN